MTRKVWEILPTLAIAAIAHSAAAQTAPAQRAKALRAAMGSRPPVAAPRHNAADLLAKYRSTTAGQAALAAAHKIATSTVPAAGRGAAGTGSGGTQSSQPGGTSATTSGTSTSGSASFDVTIDPTTSFSVVTSSSGTSVQANLWIELGAGGQFGPGTKTTWYLGAVDTLPGAADLWVQSLTPGWYVVAFDVFQAVDDGPMHGWISTRSPAGSNPVQDCTATLANKDGNGVSTCTALFQITQTGPQDFNFYIRTELAALVDVAISRINP